MLKANNIRVTLGRTEILHGINFTALPGQVTAILGPNGSGKTTLLRALTEEVRYTGQITLNGKDISGQRPWELASQRAVLPQATTLAFPFNVIEVVRLGLHQGTSGNLDEIAQAALSKVGLAHYAERFYQELSGGEKQRVQLARVLAQVWNPVQDGEPRWLLLDEPVSSLDIGHQLEVMEIAANFAKAGGGVVAVMHDLNLTAMFVDQVAIISAGQCLSFGEPAEVMNDLNLSDAYGCAIRVNTTPTEGATFLLPHAASLHALA